MIIRLTGRHRINSIVGHLLIENLIRIQGHESGLVDHNRYIQYKKRNFNYASEVSYGNNRELVITKTKEY